jgi:hypothetical protein
MVMYYVRAVDFIKEQRFEVRAPAFYHPNVSSQNAQLTPPKRQRANPFNFVAVNHLNPAPFRVNVDPDVFQNCSYTVEIMLDMFQKQIPFEVVEDKDIVHIFDGLDRYLLSIQPNVEAGDEHSTTYARLVVSWRDEVFKHYYRFLKLNPLAMDELYPNNNSVENIFTLMARINGLNYDQYKHDPLMMRKRPPYEIDKVAPLASTVGDKSNFEIREAFNLNGGKGEDGVGFDVQGFLNGTKR